MRIARTSSQDVGVDLQANLTVATASLEVGFNDPRVGLVLQPKAPHDAAAFIQPRGHRRLPPRRRPRTVVPLTEEEPPMDSVNLSAGWIESLNLMGTDVKTLLLVVGVPVLGLVFIIWAGWRSKAPGPTILAAILATVVVGLALDMEGNAGKIGEDINNYEGGSTVIGDQ
ncbi:hypothetical protein CLM83_00225 [Streptomyces albidoflavus]|nr:hypothetical protein CLM83_00225 [Streptomyces albidoflavus]